MAICMTDMEVVFHVHKHPTLNSNHPVWKILVPNVGDLDIPMVIIVKNARQKAQPVGQI